MFNIIGRTRIFLTVAAILVFASLAVIAAFGFRQGIDFAGGTLWQFASKTATPDAVREFFRAQERYAGAMVSADSEGNAFFVRLPELTEEAHQELLAPLRGRFEGVEELGFQSVGPSVGRELRRNAVVALILALFAISLYVAFVFRKVSRPVASWKYGVITLLTLFHDVAIPAGLLALLGRTFGVEVDSTFVVALLVVMGFSVHDTIVVFDRIREHLALDRGRTDFADIVNASVNQTIARSVNTSLTLVIVLLALLVAGPPSLFYFLVALLVGVVAGTYSSICVASPLLVAWQTRSS
ncbi:MAG: protein translocase subunit SecF [Candidatus Liptonbacteria bacterium]|nr:protein translocase subunit SecF [Candidatus Liptonbacteria bacterium]